MIKKRLVIIFIIPFVLLLLSSTPANASIIDNIKNFLGIGNKETPKEFAIESNIALAEGGDVDKNGEIDAGDTVTFSYKIDNPTDSKYIFSTLETGIARVQLNFIHNIKGVTGLDDKEGTVKFPNLRLEPGQILEISFDARVNYYQDEDKTIFTEPEFFDDKGGSILKSERKEIVAKKLNKEKIDELSAKGIKLNKKEIPIPLETSNEN